VNGGTFSDYSAVAGGSPVRYVVKLNLNSEAALSQASPWNNLNTLVFEGYEFENMINDKGQPTGLNFTVTDNFTSFHDGFGITTGNNSGVVPDNVMKSMYYVSLGDTARFSFTGLNRSHVYNFEFFGGSTFPYPSNSVYVIGDQSGQLNTLGNTTNTVLLTGFKPDENGEIHVTFYGTTAYSFLNSVTIYGMPGVDVGDQGTGEPPMMTRSVNPGQPSGNASATVSKETLPNSSITQVYPNPFVDNITVEFDFKRNISKFTVAIVDASGRTIQTRTFANISSGKWKQTIQMDRSLPQGVYYLQVIGLPDIDRKSYKLLKLK
jgi:hypothetical protein